MAQSATICSASESASPGATRPSGGSVSISAADYAVIGTVSNHAARLCEEAKSRQILASQRVLSAVEKMVEFVPVGELTLKGFRRPMPAYEIVRWLEGEFSA